MYNISYFKNDLEKQNEAETDDDNVQVPDGTLSDFDTIACNEQGGWYMFRPFILP